MRSTPCCAPPAEAKSETDGQTTTVYLIYGVDKHGSVSPGQRLSQLLRAQMEQHLLMVEEVLGGLDQFVQGLEQRISRIEEGLGLEPDGVSVTGWVADLQRTKSELARLRNR